MTQACIKHGEENSILGNNSVNILLWHIILYIQSELIVWKYIVLLL